MGTSPPLGAISAGLRYQVRFFWRQALPMLFDPPKVLKVVVEHDGVRAVDDVVVYYTEPGVNCRGQRFDVDFFQLKFHVAQSGAVDHQSLVDPSWTGTQAPMLQRFAEAWRSISAIHPRSRLSLVTNWTWDPRCPLAPLLRDGGVLADEFFIRGARSKVGKIRAQWQKVCALPDDAFRAFLGAVRFSTSAVSQADAEDWLRDRCQLAGLVPVATDLDHSPYDDLGARLIEHGKTEHTPDSLRALVESQRLVATKEPPFRSTFAIRSFVRFAHVPQTDGATVVDLTDLFDGRTPRDSDVWSTSIPKRVEAAVASVQASGQPVHVALDTHLSIAWFVGCLLDARTGLRVALRQKIDGKGIEVWDISAARHPGGAPSWQWTSQTMGEGTELALVVSVRHDAFADAATSVRTSLPSIGTILHAKLPDAGPHAVRDGGHARWLVDVLLREVNGKIAGHRPTHVHLFLACPASLAFLLGQGARSLGPTTVYEFDYSHPARGYLPGMSSPS